MAEYFLPDLNLLTKRPCGMELRFLRKEDLQELYLDRWQNALTLNAPERDIMAVGAYDHGILAGMAGCSADCETMYQIGVDVLPQYRHKGIASAVTSALALEILRAGKVPFYCSAWANIASVRNALQSGFKPAWAELTARDIEFTDFANSASIRY